MFSIDPIHHHRPYRYLVYIVRSTTYTVYLSVDGMWWSSSSSDCDDGSVVVVVRARTLPMIASVVDARSYILATTGVMRRTIQPLFVGSRPVCVVVPSVVLVVVVVVLLLVVVVDDDSFGWVFSVEATGSLLLLWWWSDRNKNYNTTATTNIPSQWYVE
jgi:hypothetical protein